MIKVNHHFIGEDFYFPNWEISYLFLGTFNPMGGEKVPYFYAREKNLTWSTLSKVFDVDFNPMDIDFINKLSKHKIACMDLIKSIKVDKKDLEKIIGQGYKDTNLINGSTIIEFNTKNILEVVNKNSGLKVFSTWGKGPNFKLWKEEINSIPNIINLVSPSMAARVPKGHKKKEFVFNDWKTKIILE